MSVNPRILITNDDGIAASGLKHLWAALVDFADVSVVAPSLEQSSVGLGITVRNPLHIQEVDWDKASRAWCVSGTPADCVRMALSVIFKAKPDLIVSGINRGSNSGRNILYSGTVGSVIEGVLRGVPGVAFSCGDFMNPDYLSAQEHVLSIVQHLLEHPLPKGTLLNVNFPTTTAIKGIKLARQGKGYWVESPEERVHPEGNTYYWMGGKWDEHDEHEESDVALLNAGYAAAVPIHVDQMTDHSFLSLRKEDFDRLFTR